MHAFSGCRLEMNPLICQLAVNLGQQKSFPWEPPPEKTNIVEQAHKGMTESSRSQLRRDGAIVDTSPLSSCRIEGLIVRETKFGLSVSALVYRPLGDHSERCYFATRQFQRRFFGQRELPPS